MTKFKKVQTPKWALDVIRKSTDKQVSDLNLRGNPSKEQLITVPPEIFEMTHLQSLWIGDNQLRTLPKTMGKLTNLQWLHLDNNQLTTVPEVIRQLTNLKALGLSDNQLTSIPRWLVDLPQLKNLFLFGNPIKTLPPEVLKLTRGQSVDLIALRAYFRQQAEAGEEALYEAKLLIVGEPGAGKTSLARKLIDPTAPLPSKDESTEGIDVYTWQFPLSGSDHHLLGNDDELSARSETVDEKVTNTDKQFRVNIWDFGGQEIYHATHQFFLSRRSLYIVVADAREQKTDFYHWLDLIEHLSDHSPVLIFNNQIQNRHWAINEQQLEAHFPDTFKKLFAFNLANDIVGLEYLRGGIQAHIIALPHVGDILPRTWVEVRRALENDYRATVTLEEFLQLCQRNGFSRHQDALQLSGYLHDIGVILHFQDHPVLKRTVILKPEWGTDAVYRVLDNEEVEAKQGHFNREDLKRIWERDEYAFLHDELLALMEKFQLCYAIPNKVNQYIAPQLLSEQPPTYTWKEENNLFLRFKYEAFMPKGLLSRFIVAMHQYIAQQRLVWRTGVVLFKDNTAVEITEFYPQREIRIRVAGKHKRDMLAIVIHELDKLHKPFHDLKFDRLIPCNCNTCSVAEEPYFYRLAILQTRLEHGKEVIECDKPPFNTVRIRPLLDDVGANIQSTDLPILLQSLNRAFNNDDFREVCLDVGISYDNLSGDGLRGKQRELLLKMERNGRLPELINLLRQKRPNWNW